MRMRLCCWLSLALVSLSLSGVNAAELAERIRPLIEAHEGEVSVAIKNLSTGETFLHAADRPMPTASLIKFPLMVAAYQAIEEGRLSPETMLTLREEDQVPGSGILTPHFSAGAQFTLRDAIRLMIVYSDNTATNLVIDQVGLPATAELMEHLGLPQTKLHSKVYRRESSIFPERSQEFGLGSTTAAEMLTLLEKLHRRELVSPAACEAMLDHLSACDDKLKFRRFLPKAKIAHKTGSLNAIRTDAGLIDSPAGPLAVCVLTRGNKDQSWGEENAAEILCGRIAQEAYRHFNPDGEPQTSESAGPLKLGATGPLVEGLQRTLNAQMNPSPQLSVDGDFGPATEAAVRAFQRSRGLEASGIVGPETWAALGPIVEPAAESGGDSADVVVRAPPEALDGPPIVTCKAWAIADGRTGAVLWEQNGAQPLDNASTTKIMTAFLVLRYAAEHPEVLEEMIEFSRRADETIGSSAEIRAGERVVVRDLMYGLLLPSGNDASVALAEHFGLRVASGGDVSDGGEPYGRFVWAMNAEARRLGLAATHYDNPHGLTTSTHKSSARDLLVLAWEAMQLPLFREIVNTPRYECVVEGPGGYRRKLVWRNTNRLLGMEGYLGVKTGTTTAAGACLVSHGVRNDLPLFVAVLGSASSESRYADTRNLFRWAWAQLNQTPAAAR